MSDPPITRILWVIAGLLALAATPAHAQTTAPVAEQLAERYAPVLLAKPQLGRAGDRDYAMTSPMASALGKAPTKRGSA